MYLLQQAIYKALADDSGLTAMVTGIFDFVPAGTLFPYITITESRSIDRWDVASMLTEVTITLYCYSQAKGREETSMILARISQVLSKSKIASYLTMSGITTVSFYRKNSEVFPRRADGIYRGSIQFTGLFAAI